MLESLRNQIEFRLESLLRQFYETDVYRFPEGLNLQQIVDLLYGEVNEISALQDILVDLLNQGVQSPHFVTALEVIVNYVT